MLHFWRAISQKCVFCVFFLSYVAPLDIRQNSTRNDNSSDPRGFNSLEVVTYCSTPNGNQGYCLPLKNCSKLMNQVSKSTTKNFLQKFKCGPRNDNGENPKVCCEKHSIFKHTEKKSAWPEHCGYQNVSVRGRILGGEEAALGEFPWLARLYHRGKNKVKVFGCTGFLITSEFVLTAAHCLSSGKSSYLGPIFEVRLGEHDTRTKIDCNAKNTTCAPGLQAIRIKKIFVHPSYHSASRDNHHDIGLVRLKQAAAFSNFVSPICVMKKLDFEPFEYWLSGWGKTREGTDFSHVKMKVSIPPFPRKNCTTKFQELNVKIIEEQLCAGGKKNKDSCAGDSGGPLMLVKDSNHWFAVGVVSYGYGCGREGWPGIYTNITSYYNWITQKLQSNVKVKSTSKTWRKIENSTDFD